MVVQKQRTILITGSSGIAEAAAMLADREGWRVFIAGHDALQCRQLSAKLANASYFACDLRDERLVENAFQQCHDQLGAIDAVFNVAGGSGRSFGDGPIHECSLKGWEETFALNARIAFLVSRQSVRYWLRARLGGSLLNISSVLAFSPQPVHFATHAYAASKGAIISLSRAMASYYAEQKICVNVIAPALVKTPMSLRAQENSEIAHYVEKKQPLSAGFLQPEDIAEAAIFLLSEKARHITGQVFSVDGGWSVSG